MSDRLTMGSVEVTSIDPVQGSRPQIPQPLALNFELLSHISPIGWDNVLLYGEYQLNRSLVRSERLSV